MHARIVYVRILCHVFVHAYTAATVGAAVHMTVSREAAATARPRHPSDPAAHKPQPSLGADP